jgi:predicted RND superfamily exporter protein
MKYMRNIKATLVMILILALAVKVLVWVIMPFVPVILTVLLLLGVFGFLYHRSTRL